MLQPTIIYTKIVLALLENFDVHGLCHITGGGLTENIPRVIPDGLIAMIDTNNWNQPTIFNWLQEAGQVDNEEMLRVFNCGMGMLVVLPNDQAKEVIKFCQDNKHQAVQIGVINKSLSDKKIILQ